jgi:Holliday junction resolvase
MASKSAQKGNLFERELAAWLRTRLGVNAHRAALSGGGRFLGVGGGADLVGTPGVWIEAKRTERLAIPEALRQAETAIGLARAPEMPVVIARTNRMPTEASYVVMRLQDWALLYEAYLHQQGYERDDSAL